MIQEFDHLIIIVRHDSAWNFIMNKEVVNKNIYMEFDILLHIYIKILYQWVYIRQIFTLLITIVLVCVYVCVGCACVSASACVYHGPCVGHITQLCEQLIPSTIYISSQIEFRFSGSERTCFICNVISMSFLTER